MIGEKSQFSVLLVDDDEEDYRVTRDLLLNIEKRPFDLDWVATYDAALESIAEGKYDACLMDYHMGKTNGLELLRQVIMRGCSTPIIMLTGHAGDGQDIAALRAGAADFLVKGQIETAMLERSLRYAMERNRAAEALKGSEARFKRSLDGTAAGTAPVQTDGRWLPADKPAYGTDTVEGMKPFALGNMTGSDEVLRLLDDANRRPSEFFKRHARGDWGEVDDEQRAQNGAALDGDGELVSRFRLTGAMPQLQYFIFVVTDAGRKTTRLLLPGEFKPRKEFWVPR